MIYLSDQKRLLTFKTLYEHRSFTHVAQLLFISQSTVSLHIKSLEDELNIQLFERNGKSNSVPTQHATLLYQYVVNQFHDWESLTQTFYNASTLALPCKLAVSHTYASCYLSDLIVYLNTHHPTIQFEIFIENSQTIFDTLTHDGFDIGIIEKPLSSKHIVRHELMDDLLVLAGNSDHDLWLLREANSGVRYFTDLYLTKENIAVERSMTIHSNALICDLINSGVGRSIVSSKTLKPATHFESLSSEFSRKYYLIHPTQPSSFLLSISESILTFNQNNID